MTNVQMIRFASNKLPKMNFVLVLLFLGLVLSLPTAASAAVYTVDNTSDNGALTACTAAANDCSLRGAVNAANSSAANDTINFDAGVFGSPQTITLGGSELVIANNGTLTINGTGANLLTVSGNNASRVFYVSPNANLTLNSLTVSNGNGFGLVCCFFGIGTGGGIFNDSGTLSVLNSSISGNAAVPVGPGGPVGGGGIFSSGTLNLINSTVSGNSGNISGGGILIPAGTANLINTTISGNSATVDAGGIFKNEATVNMINSTVSGNSCNSNGGGIYSFPIGNFNIRNSIIAGNTGAAGPDFFGVLTSQGHNLIGNASNTTITGNTTSNITNVNAMLAPLAFNGGPTRTHALLPGSLAINSGNNALATDQNNQPLTNDQRGTGFPRISGSSVDMGSFELFIPPLPVVTENPQSQTVNAGNPVTFTSRGGVFSQSATFVLFAGQALLPGQFIISPNYGYQLIYQLDGNLVLYRGDGTQLWASGTGGTSPGQAAMQTDGNFVIYNSVGTPLFASNTLGNPGSSLHLQDDGNVVILNAGATPIFETGTYSSHQIPSVQWQVSTDNGANFTNIGGATTPILTFTAQSTDNGRQYRAVFTNVGGSVASAAAVLTVIVPTLPTTTTITADTPDPTVSGDPFTVSYTVAVVPPGTGTPTGSVFVSDGVNSCTGTVAAGQCSLALSTPGNRTLTATYYGDANFSSSVSPGEPHTVTPGSDLNLTVDTTSGDGNLSACTNAPNDCSLSGAVNRANNSSGNDTINFDAGVFSIPQTISLFSNPGNVSQLIITNNGTLTINGPGADKLSVSTTEEKRIFEVVGAVAEINGMTIRDGFFNQGGGFYIDGGTTLTLNNVTVRNNRANDSGGGIYNLGNLTINNSTIRDNTASQHGGGIYNQLGTMAINNSTISGNSANRDGGGLYDFVGNTTLYYSTVSNNTSSSINPTGAIYSFFGVTNIYNTIVANNTGENCLNDGSTINAVHSLFGNSAACVNGVNLANLTGDPNLGPLQYNGGTTETHALLPGSIAIDAANPTDFPSNDQRGFLRPVNGNFLNSAEIISTNILGVLPDIGSFEALAPTAASVSISGRVFSLTGRGVANAVVHFTDQNGNTKTARTNPFGYYRFQEIEVGQTLIVNVFSKSHRYNSRIINFEDNLTDLDFYPQETITIKRE